MRISFTLEGADGPIGTFDAWTDGTTQYVEIRNVRTGECAQSIYQGRSAAEGNPWRFVSDALRDLDVQAMQERLEATQTALAKLVHAS